MPRKPPMDKGNLVKPELNIDLNNPPAKQYSKEGDIDLINQKRGYKVITPLMGGGVENRKNDPETPVSAKGVRGQLRLWWRACRASYFPTLEEMKKSEDEIWGSTDKHSLVSLEIECVRRNVEPGFWIIKDPKKADKHKVENSPLIARYAALPLMPDNKQQQDLKWKSPDVFVDVKFTITIRYPKKLTEDIAATLWAWETFGGVGARTRRGFGAIQLVELDNKNVLPPDFNNSSQMEELLRENLGKYANGKYKHNDNSNLLTHIPKLNPNMKIALTSIRTSVGKKDGCIVVWHQLIELLKWFRQSRYVNEYGKSMWPEADAIRFRLGRKDKTLINKFPRAAFGLPIIFYLPYDNKIEVKLFGVNGQGEKLERLASPLILRPLACNSNQGIGLAIILDTPQVPPNGLLLEGRNVSNKPEPSAILTQADANSIAPLRVNPDEPLRGNPDVLAAFLETVNNG